MSDGARDRKIADDTAVTTIIRQQPLPGEVERYEAWLKEIIPIAQSFAGHQSVNVIRPQIPGEPYTIALHFDSVDHLCDWLNSETRVRLVEKIRPALRAPEAIDIKTGFEFWFTPPPTGKPAKPWKQFLVTLSAIFPLTILVPWTLHPVVSSIGVLGLPGIRHLLIAAVIVALMVYVIMPHYTRAVAHWLFR